MNNTAAYHLVCTTCGNEFREERNGFCCECGEAGSHTAEMVTTAIPAGCLKYPAEPWGEYISYFAKMVWLESERQAYYNIAREHGFKHEDAHKMLNLIEFGHIRNKISQFSRVASFGGATGSELDMFVGRPCYCIKKTVVEPCVGFHTELNTTYIDPGYMAPSRKMCDDQDLFTCLNVLHHLPDPSRYIEGIYECLNNGGYAIFREPIGWMGDWTKPRAELSRHERGLPREWFLDTIVDAGFKIESVQYALTGFHFLDRKLKKMGLNINLLDYPAYIYFDKMLSWLLRWNIRYHRTRWWHNLAPSSITIIAKKA